MGDYIFPNFIVRALRTPSPRTQMESSLIGIAVMMLGSLAVTSYILINTDISGWFKFFIIASELGILSFQFSLLSTTYQNYREYKLQNEMYPRDYKLKLKMDEAKSLIKELNLVVYQMKGGKI